MKCVKDTSKNGALKMLVQATHLSQIKRGVKTGWKHCTFGNEKEHKQHSMWMVSSVICRIMTQEIPLVGSKNFNFESFPHPQEEVVPPRWQRTQGLFTFFHGCFILSAESGDQRCPLSKGICRNNCDFGYYYEYIYLKVKRRLQGTGVIKISSQFSNRCPHLHQ